MSRPCLTRVAAGLALALSATAIACVHQTLPAVSAAPGIAPRLVLERFLSAANCVSNAQCASKAQDIETMGRLFGTEAGPIVNRDPRADVEQRMYALASLLQSQDYRIDGQNIVPGRVNEAVQLMVRIRQNDRDYDVPFILVHARNGDWLVENVDLKPLNQAQ